MLEAQVAELVRVVATRDVRIAELEALLEESRRGGKRQAAPLSKGEPNVEPARPGRKRARCMAAMVIGQHRWNRTGSVMHRCRSVARTVVRVSSSSGGRSSSRLSCPSFARWSPGSGLVLAAVGDAGAGSRAATPNKPPTLWGPLGPGRASGHGLGNVAALWAGTELREVLDRAGPLGDQRDRGGDLFVVWVDQHCSGSHPPGDQGHVASSPVVTMDETGWRIGGTGVWLWVAATDDATIYDVARGRGFDQAVGLVRPATPAQSSVTAGLSTTATPKPPTKVVCPTSSAVATK